MRKPAPSIAALIDRQRDALDRLAARLAVGIRSAAEFDELEARAVAIGNALRDAFRSKR